MPTPNNESLANANRLQSGQGQLASNLQGVTTHYPIYDLDYAILLPYVNNLAAIINTNHHSPNSMANQWCQNRRENHRDDAGNLPHALAQGEAFCEYHIPANQMPYSGHIRLIYDTQNAEIFISPSHYDPWQDNHHTNRNPFYRIVNPPAFNFGGDVDF